MENDRKVIYNIISEMLDNPNSQGIYPIDKAYDDLEKYIKTIRFDNKCDCNQSSLTSTAKHKCIKYNKDKQNDPLWARYISCHRCIDFENTKRILKKFKEIKDNFNVFVYEMDLLMHEMEIIKKNNKNGENNETSEIE